MPLKKLCNRCGTLIDYKDKYCNRCAVIAEREKSERNRIYDTEFRNKENNDIYQSKQWKLLTKQCKQKFKGIDVYSYYILGEVTFGNISHHIVEINEDKERAYDINNLIYVGSTHKTIHSAYDKNDKDKKDMQELLFSLVKRWETEFGI